MSQIAIIVTEQQIEDLSNLILRSQSPCTFEDNGEIQCLHCTAVIERKDYLLSHKEDCEILSANRLKEFRVSILRFLRINELESTQ